MKQNITIGFSPCPNDTFIFDALINKKIDTEGFNFDAAIEDVETLNQWAIDGRLDITKLSYGALPLVLDKYAILNSGSALGKGVGPLLIKNEELKIKTVEENIVAIPGENTTAHLLFSLAYPNAKKKIFLRYDEIETFVLENKGLGVIIHENRFTYEQKGLKKIIDLGDYWETKTGHSIPLGGIVVSKSFEIEVQRKIDALIKKSIEYSYLNYPVLSDYVRIHAQEMNEDIMRKHIDLYVNNYTINLGDEGRSAIKKLMELHQQLYDCKVNCSNIFVD